jgi:eukaryotic-like serine/threonine-protein kinase
MDDTLSREEELFDAARKMDDPAQRGHFLERACDGDPDLRRRVETLLSIHSHAEELFTECITALRTSADNPESSVAPRDLARGFEEEQPGAHIGHYKILQKIGEGGCGAVYMAEQEKPMRRLVALKVIKLGMDTRAVIARFDAERQALAMMDHPNIAKVLDAGATHTGRPYFVMELVRGTRITDYCDQNQLDTRHRLELFIQICHAIQHAHQKGIIHRDIKPSNIIVTLHDGLPVPKVIDFGIAKATAAPLTDKTLVTIQNQFIGTPAYMSPEQAGTGGLDIDTRSDIYSLGVLLYELLTGKTPFDPKTLTKSGVDEMRRTLLEVEPQRPSALLTVLAGDDLIATAVRRHAEPPRLIALIRGDLDWMVMKALEKERARRYETANGLAMDIRRHLNNEPVLARPPSRAYRLHKLVRRNKGVFVAAAAVSAALIAGLGTSTWLFLKEREARQRAVAAERQQARLTQEAELARSNEAKLRLQAEARERITQAAIVVSQGRFDEADKMVNEASPTEPSVEAAALLRSLSQWHALQDRWARAVDRFGLLLQVNQLDGWDQSTLDFLGCGVCLIESGHADHYDRFGQLALSRFASTTNGVAAERIVKICLLKPPDQSVLESLAPLARVAEEAFATPDSHDSEAAFRAAWESVSLALWEYRRGHYASSIDWARRCLACPEPNAPRAAAAHVELAMAYFKSSHMDQALAELSQGRQSIEDKFNDVLEPGSAAQGFWFDWVFARILLREATGLFDPCPSGSP